MKVETASGYIKHPSDEEYRQAVDILEHGGIVAIPTETFYGLAVDPFNEKAVAALYGLKSRSCHKPLLLVVSDERQLATFVESVPSFYGPLMKRFWPGPLTLVFPALPVLPAIVTAGASGVAVRVSPHPVTQRLLKMWGKPLTATSANISGKAAVRSAEDVQRIFPVGIGCILDGGRTTGGMSSTVVGMESGGLRLIRAGAVDYAAVLDTVEKSGV